MEILSNPQSEYNKIYEAYKEEYESRTAHLFSDEDFIIHDADIVFSNWSENILQKLKNILKDEITYCNQEKIFFRGCNFENYNYNYKSNLLFFTKVYEDASEIDFIEDEIKYYENSVYDIQNAEASTDRFSINGLDNFIYLSKIIDVIGYKQFELSTNKILVFLEDLKFKLSIKTENTKISITDLVHNIKNTNLKKDYEDFQALKNDIDDFISRLELDITQNYNDEKYLNFLAFINLVKDDASNDMQNTLQTIPEADKIKFFQMMLPKIKEQFSALKEKHYNNEISNFLNKNVVQSIVKTENISIPKTRKIADKWYALLYLIEVEVYKKEIPTNFEGAFIKSKIEEIGKQKCKNSGQGFYRQVRDLKGNINSNINIKRLFNDNWKNVIIDLSNNDENIIKYLDTYFK
jgi:hypothetical protein